MYPVTAGVVLPLMCMQAFLTSTHLGIAMEYAWWAACVCYLAALLGGRILHLASKCSAAAAGRILPCVQEGTTYQAVPDVQPSCQSLVDAAAEICSTWSHATSG